jgi:hypothetical protein
MHPVSGCFNCTEIFDSSIKDKSVISSSSMCPGLLVCTRNEPIGLMIKKKQINSEFMILLIKSKLLCLQDIC